MGLGALVRKQFGRHERRIAALYRSIYIDLDAWLSQIQTWVPDARRILEIGAGEGAMTERLAQAYPAAEILAIDVADNVGRLCEPVPSNVTFLVKTVQAVAAERPGEFDLVLLSDVIHHVPLALRDSIFDTLPLCLAPGGRLVFKDWGKNATPIHLACWASDRFLTGDRVSYLVPEAVDAEIIRRFGTAAIKDRAWIAPWRNNFALLVGA